MIEGFILIPSDPPTIRTAAKTEDVVEGPEVSQPGSVED
jgi:hypothetical protein